MVLRFTSATRTRRGRVALFLAPIVSSLLFGCDLDRPNRLRMLEADRPSGRPSDGLLERSDLQGIVDLQVERDGPALITALDDPVAAVRARVAFALASVQDVRSTPALLRALRDTSPDVRRDAAFALGQLTAQVFERDFARGGLGAETFDVLDQFADPGGVQRLRALLQGTSGNRREAAADQAARGTSNHLAQLILERLAEESRPEVRLRMLEAIGKLSGTGALPSLLALELAGEERRTQSLAVSRVAARGVVTPAAARWSISRLSDPDPQVRLNASYYFVRPREARPWRNEMPRFRAAVDSMALDDPAGLHVALGIEKAGIADDLSRITRFLRGSPDWRVRANAAAALLRWGKEHEQRDALLAALSDDSHHVGIRAAAALNRSSPAPAQVEQLMDWVRLNPERVAVAAELTTGIVQGGRASFAMDWVRQFDVSEALPWARTLQAMDGVAGTEAAELFAEAALAPKRALAIPAVGGLVRRWRTDRMQESTHDFYWRVFTSVLARRDPVLTSVVAEGLADNRFLSRGVLDLLSAELRGPLLSDEDEARRAIVVAIGRITSLDAVDVLRRSLDDPSIRVRVAAAAAMRGLTGEAVPITSSTNQPALAPPGVDWDRLAELGRHPRLVLETDRGRVVVMLDSEEAPLTVQTIAGFAQDGLYDGVPFHRVEPNFVVQTGDFARGDGRGGPGFDIVSEFTQIPYRRGVIGMASAGKDTEGSQFFVTHSMSPHLDGAYTAFGWVVDGMDVVDRIQRYDEIRRAWIERDTS